MFKRLFLIALFTGAAQLFSILVLQFMAAKQLLDPLSELASLDSLFFFILNLVALGLQSSAIRNIALSGDWKTEYINTQSARCMMGILLASLGLLALENPIYALFLLAPFIALSGDYALYALGHPVMGAFVSFLRAVIPYVFVLIAVSIDPAWLIPSFMTGVFIAFTGTSFFIASYIHAPYFVRPQWRNLWMYYKSLALGMVNLSMYFIGLGLLLIIPWLYPETTVALSFAGLKFYFIYKGILRIIHQAFVKEMLGAEAGIKVDQLSMLCGLCFLTAVTLFPHSFILLFFGKTFLDHPGFFFLLGLGALVYSFALSLGTRMMLERRDRGYTWLAIVSALVTILATLVISQIYKWAEGIPASILLGEITFMCGLLYLNPGAVPRRLLFFLESAPFIIIPLVTRWLGGDTLYMFIAGMCLYGFVMIYWHRKKFGTLGAG